MASEITAFQCIMQPNTSLHDCIYIQYILYLAQYLCDPGILPGFADHCILWNVYLRFDLSSLPNWSFAQVVSLRQQMLSVLLDHVRMHMS